MRNGVSTEEGTLVRNEQIGARLYREALYTVTANDSKFGLLLQLLTNSSAATTAHSLTLRSVNLSIESWRGQHPTTGADAMLDERLLALKSDVIDTSINRFSVTSDDMFKLMAPSCQVLNGASYRLDNNGRIIGFSIAAGQSGKTTCFRVYSGSTGNHFATRWFNHSAKADCQCQ
jgi:hypothetical protein